MSSNGKLLEETMKETNTIPISTMADEGNWTRVNRHNHEEKSIIDYILIDKEGKKQVQEIKIDEIGWL